MVSIPSPCAAALKEAVKAGSTVGSCQYVTPKEPALKLFCPNNLPPPAVNALDKKVICTVFCCCLKAPNVGATSGNNLYQSCVLSTLGGADSSLDWKSRYKAEISYSMLPGPGHPKAPYPLMHRANGKDTTQPSTNWQQRAGGIPGYKSGKGLVRRPDVVIVKDPTKPPTTDNIVQVIEMKFPGDPVDKEQLAAYSKIAGGRGKVALYDENECGCKKKEKEQTQPALDPSLVLALYLSLLKILLQQRLPSPAPAPDPVPKPIPAPEPPPILVPIPVPAPGMVPVAPGTAPVTPEFVPEFVPEFFPEFIPI